MEFKEVNKINVTCNRVMLIPFLLRSDDLHIRINDIFEMKRINRPKEQRLACHSVLMEL